MTPALTWITVLTLVSLVVVAVWAVLEIMDGNDAEPDPDLDEIVPNERCVDCGQEVEQNHYACQGHQFCLPECPRCGGRLVEIG